MGPCGRAARDRACAPVQRRSARLGVSCRRPLGGRRAARARLENQAPHQEHPSERRSPVAARRARGGRSGKRRSAPSAGHTPQCPVRGRATGETHINREQPLPEQQEGRSSSIGSASTLRHDQNSDSWAFSPLMKVVSGPHKMSSCPPC